MARFRKHGAGWQAQIMRKGYPARYRTFDTKDAAQAWAVQVEAEMVRGVYKDPTTALNTTFADAEMSPMVTPVRVAGVSDAIQQITSQWCASGVGKIQTMNTSLLPRLRPPE